MSELPKYQPDAICPKCNHEMVAVHYCATESAGKLCWCYKIGKDYIDTRKEHLHRMCTLCGYEWLEACLDDTDGVWFDDGR